MLEITLFSITLLLYSITQYNAILCAIALKIALKMSMKKMYKLTCFVALLLYAIFVIDNFLYDIIEKGVSNILLIALVNKNYFNYCIKLKQKTVA